jgi:vitamin B12 transporter
MKSTRLFLALFVAILLPLAAQNYSGEGEGYNEDDLPGDWLIMEGEGLTILGSANTTQQMEIIDRETIEKTHAPDLPSLLAEAAGLGVTRYGPFGNMADVNIRGFNTRRIAVLVDGIPVNSAASGDFDFNSIDPLSIERIEIIHGGSDTKFNVSGALGGTINIITVKKAKPGWSLGGNFTNTSFLPGQFNKQNSLTGTPQWQDLADSQNVNIFGTYGTELYSLKINVFGNRAGNHFLYQDYYGFTRRKEGNEILDAGTSVSLLRNIGDYSKLIASGSFYFGDKHVPISAYSSNYEEQRDMSSREILMLDMPRAFHDDFSTELSLGHNWSKTFTEGGNTASNHNENDLTIINRWSWYPGTKFTLRFGGDYRFINLDSTDTGLHFGNRGGLYITPEYSPIRKLLLIASLKGMTDGRDLIPVPKLGFSWLVNDGLTIKNNYFRSFKFPDFNDLYWVSGGFKGNPDLKSEDGWGTDLTMELSLKDLINLNSTLYGEWTDNSIHWNNSSGIWRPENYGAAAFFGWDNRVNFILPVYLRPLEKPVLSLSWLFQLSWLLSGDLFFEDNKRIPYMPIHTLGVSLELPWKTKAKKLPGSLIVSGRFESLRYADTENIIKLNPCFLLNVTYNQTMNNNFSFFGKINNALNASYVSFADYPMPGISLSLGMNMIF